MAEKSTISLLVKIFAYLLLWPIFRLIWVWNKSNWPKSTNWLATAGTVVVFLLVIMASNTNNDTDQLYKDATINSQIAAQKQLEAKKQNDEKQADVTQVEEQKNEPTAAANQEIFKVAHVVDGDTIKLDNGQVVRYIGIDTPETVDPRKPVQCFGKEASNKNRELVEGKEVKLIKDVSETDKYGRILRYVYIGDVFVNDYLVRQGYAHSYSYPPDIKHQDQFKQAEEEARNNKRGLWVDNTCEKTTTSAPTTPTPPSGSNLVGTGAYSCNCGKTCAQMDCAEAQYQLNSCGCSRRDADKDGVACDSNCQ